MPTFSTLEALQDFAAKKGWSTLTNYWTLAEVSEALQKGWMVGWVGPHGQLVVPTKIECSLGVAFTREQTIAFWDSKVPAGPAGKTPLRVIVALPLGQSVPRDLLQSANAEGEQWLLKLRHALQADELGRGWQLFHELETTTGPCATLEEAAGRLREAAHAAFPASTWISPTERARLKADHTFIRKCKAAERLRDLPKLHSTLLGRLRSQRQAGKDWDNSEWEELLGQLLSTAARLQQIPTFTAYLEERWKQRGDAMSLGDAVTAFLRLGQFESAQKLLAQAVQQIEVLPEAKLLECLLDALEGHVNEAVATLDQLDPKSFTHLRWIELAIDLALHLGRQVLAEKYALEGLRLKPGNISWWELLAEAESRIDPDHGRRRIWHQALRTRSGDAPLYQAALAAARKNGPLAWEGMILDDWAALCVKHPVYLLEKGITAAAQDRMEDARDLLTKATDYEDTRFAAQAALARLHSSQGKPEAAAGLLLDAWRSHPDALPLWQELLLLAAKATVRQELLAEAANLVRTKKAHKPLFEAWWQNAQNLPSAPAQLWEIAMARPDLAEPTVLAAQGLMRLKKDEEAGELLRTAVHRHFLNAPLWKERAVLQELISRGPTADSAIYWQQAAVLGNDSAAWLSLAAWQESQNDTSERTNAERAANFADRGKSVKTWAAISERAAARKDVESGMRFLANALYRQPLDGGLWRKMLKQCEAAGSTNYAEQTADWICLSSPDKPDSWLAAARLHLHLDQETKFRAALAKARELEPRAVDSYALDCQWHAKHKQFKQAQDACTPSIFGTKLEDVPVALRARHAWVESVRGDLEAAIKLMRPVLEAVPDNEWARQEMLGWLSATGQQREAEALLNKTGQEQMTLRQVRSAASQERLESLGEVSTVYEKLRIFDQLLQNRRIEEASKVLEDLRINHSGPLVIARSVAMAVAISDKQRVQDALDLLIETKTDDRWSLETAVDGYEKMFGRPRLLNYIEKRSRELDLVLHPGLLTIWVRKLNENTWKGLPSRVLECLHDREDAALAVIDYLNQMAEAGRKARSARNWLDSELRAMEVSLNGLEKREEDWLCHRHDTWLAVGTAWNALGRPKRAYSWFRSSRPEKPTPEALDQLMLAMQGTGRHAQALETANQGLEISNPKAFPRFSVWKALDASFHKDFDKSAELLAPLGGGMSEDLRTVSRLAKMLNRVGTDEIRPEFNDSIKSQFREFWAANRSLKPMHVWKKALRQVSVRCLSLRPIAWGFWTHNHKWIRAAFFVSGLLVVLLMVLEIKYPQVLPWHRNQHVTPTLPTQP